MSDLNECDDCTRCAACGRRWCRAWETSPGEASDLCVECWATEDVGDPFGEWLKGAWPA